MFIDATAASTLLPITSSANVTFLPNSSSKRLAIGAIENSGFFFPFGRPKWLITIKEAPLSNNALIVGRAALIRVSSPTTPSFTGTLKSTRIKTFLSAQSHILIVCKTIIILFSVIQACHSDRPEDSYLISYFTNFFARSTTRWEYPISLSYQERTLTSFSPIFIVRRESKIEE